MFGLFIIHYFTNFPSRSNSRATTPERSITRQVSSVSSVSNDSNESNTANGKKGDPSEKLALQNELIELKKRSDELQSILGANKRTISTRVCVKSNLEIQIFWVHELFNRESWIYTTKSLPCDIPVVMTWGQGGISFYAVNRGKFCGHT